MSKKIVWSGVAAAVVVVAGVLAWQLWPEDEPTLNDQLAGVAGVVKVKDNDSVVLSADAGLASLKSSVAKVSAVVEKDGRSIFVLIGETYFRVEQGRDHQRATELAWATAGIKELESAQIVMVSDELIDAKLPKGASLVDATDQLLDRFAEEGLELPDDTVQISIPAATYETTEVRISRLSLRQARSAQKKVAAVLESSGAELLQAELSDLQTDVTVETSELSDIATVRRSFLDEIGRQDENRLSVRSGDLQVSRVLDQAPDEAIDLVKKVTRTGATVTSVDGGLEDISIQAPTDKAAERALRLMSAPAWTLKRDGRIRLLVGEGKEDDDDSVVSGDTASVVRMGPTFLKVLRAGYRAGLTLRVDGEGREAFGIRPRIKNGYPDPDVSDKGTALELIKILRSGDWPGRMQLVVNGSATVFVAFISTTDGRAGKVQESPNTPPDLQEVVDGLKTFVKLWNASGS